MGRHTPSTEELENAIADVLEKAPQENLTAKEVRLQLQQENEGWKIPGERRVAKFMNRQQSFRKKKKKKDRLFNLFKGQGGSSSRNNNDHDNNNTQQEKAPVFETHPEMNGSEKERKGGGGGGGGFRKSLARVLSPSGRSSSSRKSATSSSLTSEKPKTTTLENFQKFKDEPSIKFISEIDESEKPYELPMISDIEDNNNNEHPTEEEVKKLQAQIVADKTPRQAVPLTPPMRVSQPPPPPPPTPPPTTTTTTTSSPPMPMPMPTKEEKGGEIVAAYTNDTEDLTIEKKLSVVEEAYDDDNDGKKSGCECEGCIIL